jgi:sirohydrochlorin ferrochelatase
VSPRHLLIVAHGSRRAASNEEVRQLAGRVRELRSPGIDHVETAFLELAEPDITAGLMRCVELGAREIVLFPYFLAAGTHVVEDIPEVVAAFRAAYPDVTVRITGHLGASESLPRAILEVAASPQPA